MARPIASTDVRRIRSSSRRELAVAESATSTRMGMGRRIAVTERHAPGPLYREPAMDSQTTTNSPELLQFDRAEFHAPSADLVCGICKQPPRDEHYRSGSLVMCATCAERVRREGLPARGGS